MKCTRIFCPKCHKEYLPGEIFMPNYLCGQPTRVIRDIDKTVLDYDGLQQDLTEEYICDDCKTKFFVNATINYDVVSSIKPKLFLSED